MPKRVKSRQKRRRLNRQPHRGPSVGLARTSISPLPLPQVGVEAEPEPTTELKNASSRLTIPEIEWVTPPGALLRAIVIPISIPLSLVLLIEASLRLDEKILIGIVIGLVLAVAIQSLIELFCREGN